MVFRPIVPPTLKEGLPLPDFLEAQAQQPFELIRGERRFVMPTVFGHGEVLNALYALLLAHVRALTLGIVLVEATFILQGDTPTG